jgi:hypothetical protein
MRLHALVIDVCIVVLCKDETHCPVTVSDVCRCSAAGRAASAVLQDVTRGLGLLVAFGVCTAVSLEDVCYE